MDDDGHPYTTFEHRYRDLIFNKRFVNPPADKGSEVAQTYNKQMVVEAPQINPDYPCDGCANKVKGRCEYIPMSRGCHENFSPA
jgi:hypothetical protein